MTKSPKKGILKEKRVDDDDDDVGIYIGADQRRDNTTQYKRKRPNRAAVVHYTDVGWRGRVRVQQP